MLKCLFKWFTGYDCSFCGAQRAFKALLEGDIITCIRYNPYLVLISPYLIVLILIIFKVIPDDTKFAKIICGKWAIIIAGILSISWTIFRNTSYYHSLGIMPEAEVCTPFPILVRLFHVNL